MEEKLRELLQDAFAESPAHDANVAIARARRERAGGNPDDRREPGRRGIPQAADV